MPRVPGRESTQKTIKLDKAVCHSFLMYHEFMGGRFDKKVCCIKGCDHRIGECEPATGGSLPAYVGYEDRLDIVVGVACSHCVNEILA